MRKKVFFCFIFLFLYNAAQSSWELYDRVIAVVNEVPIVESELLNKFRNKNKKKRVPRSRIKYEKSRILDELIENAILYETAMDESILVSDERVMSNMERIMKPFFIKKIKTSPKKLDERIKAISQRILARKQGLEVKKDKKLDRHAKQFTNFIVSQKKMPFTEFFEEMRIQIRKEQIISIAIGVSPPTKKEAKRWYSKNKRKLGYEIHVKHILIRAKKGSLSSQTKTYNKLKGIRNKILKGVSFEKMAKKYSQDRGSAVKGGDIGWTHIGTLDPYFAGNVHKLKKRGEISPVFKSGFGYHIAKYLGRKVASFETMQRMIMYKLHNENLQKQYVKWVALKRRTADIKIFMSNYIKRK